MITLTETAQARIFDILKSKGQEGFAIRLRITGRNTDNFLYEFRTVEEATRRADDTVVDCGGFKVFIDSESAPHLQGAVIDFGGLGAGGLRIDNPNPVWTDEVARQVAAVITEQINPAIALHSGSITLVDVKDHVAYIRMQGGCQGCGMAGVTLRQGIERQIRQQVPQITAVIDVTEHEKGQAPYYAQGQTGESPMAR